MSSPEHPFLTARWENLLLLTWQVPDAALSQLLPPGTELDRWDGSALVSLVAFDFVQTRVWGFQWPGLTNFPELNLRFYVRSGSQRGVCFIREYVPSAILATTARLLYNEPYRRAAYRKNAGAHVLRIQQRCHRIAWRVEGEPFVPSLDSVAHFLKEHSHGYGRSRDGRLLRYRVDHPFWRVWPIVKPDLDVDSGALYGPAWSFLAQTPPWSVIAAEGSEVSVFGAQRS
jgi:uncharacterized protein YqjF (DUF2071 family)